MVVVVVVVVVRSSLIPGLVVVVQRALCERVEADLPNDGQEFRAQYEIEKERGVDKAIATATLLMLHDIASPRGCRQEFVEGA